MYDKAPFSAADEAAMLELLYASKKTPDGELINYFQLSNGNPEPVPRPFRDFLKQIANIMLPGSVYTDKGLNEPDFGSLNLDIDVDEVQKAVNVKLGRKAVRLALVDDNGNIIEDDNRTIYRDVISDAAHRLRNGPYNGRRTA